MVGTTNRSMAAICDIWLRRKAPPALTGRAAAGHILGDGRLSHRKTELEQLAMNARLPEITRYFVTI
jgi:hypothetical protein